MPKRSTLFLLLALLLSSATLVDGRAGVGAWLRLAPGAAVAFGNDREQDGLAGPVRRVKTETAKITVRNGKSVEAPRALLEATTYDNKGNRVDNAYFLAAGGSLTGKEVYKYDDKGNIVEMTLHNEDGTLVAKEVYAYEFDAFGNWTKMTTSVAIIEGGKLTFEPSEVTYRTISYFLDEATLARMSQPAAAATAPANASDKAGASAAEKMSAAAVATQGGAPRGGNGNKAVPLALATLPSVDRVAPAGLSAAPVVPAAPEMAAGGPVVKSETEAPAPEPVRPRGLLKPVSGGILNGKALSLPAPTYPEMAKRMRATGLVEVEVVIDLSGKVISAKATSGPAMLREAAEKAALLARFSPTLLSGQPVKVSGSINYNFSLGQ